MPGSQLDWPLPSPYSLPFLSWGLAVIGCWLKWSCTTCFSLFSYSGLAVQSCYFVQDILLLLNLSHLNRRSPAHTSTFQPWPDFQALPWCSLHLWQTGQYNFSCFYFNFYLSRWHQHPHWVHSCACPSRRAGSPKGGIHFLYTAHHPNG